MLPGLVGLEAQSPLDLDAHAYGTTGVVDNDDLLADCFAREESRVLCDEVIGRTSEVRGDGRVVPRKGSTEPLRSAGPPRWRCGLAGLEKVGSAERPPGTEESFGRVGPELVIEWVLCPVSDPPLLAPAQGVRIRCVDLQVGRGPEVAGRVLDKSRRRRGRAALPEKEVVQRHRARAGHQERL